MNLTRAHIYQLWDRYQLPLQKRIHVSAVCDVAQYIAKQCMKLPQMKHINTTLLSSASLLHDIDKAIIKLPGEIHPDGAVRVLRSEGLSDVASIVKTHSLYAILDPIVCPKTWEEKILFLADKMVKYSVITVDERFKLWRNEDLPPEALKKLDECYPRVKQLESEIFSLIHISPREVRLRVQISLIDTM